MALLLALVIVLISLAIAPGWFFYFDVTPKIVLLLLGTAVAVVWWAAGGAAGLYRASRPARWFLLVLWGTALFLAVSTAVSVNPALSVGGSNWRYWGLLTQLAALLFAYLLCASCAGQPDRLRVILRGIAAGGALVALYGIAQYFGWDPLLDPRGYHEGDGIYKIVRPPSTLGHANYSANWLLFVLFASGALTSLEKQAVWKAIAWIAIVTASIAIVLSGTRAAMLGMVAGAAVILVWRSVGRGETRRNWISARVAWGALAIVAGVALFYLSPAGAKMRARVHWALAEPAGGARLLLWRDSLRMMHGRWAAGYGPETFIAAFALRQSPELSRAYPDFYHESPHNIFMDALASEGLAGPLLLMMLAAAGFAAAANSQATPAAALAGGLAAMTLSEQFTSFTMPTALAYYATVALLVSTAVPAALPSTPGGRLWRLAAAACTAVLLLFFGVRLGIADTALGSVRRDLDANRVRAAGAHYASYESNRWPGAGADLWYSRRLAQIAVGNADRVTRIAAFQQAGLAAQRAPLTSESPFIADYNLAAFYASRNDFAHTEQSLRAAIAGAPNWFKTHWMLAQVLQAAARLPEAETEAATAAALDGGKHPEVAATLARIREALRTPPIEPPHK